MVLHMTPQKPAATFAWGPGALGPDGFVYHRKLRDSSPWGLDNRLISANIKGMNATPTAPVPLSVFPYHPVAIQLGHCSPVNVDYVGEALREYEARSIADQVAKQIVEWLWARGLDVAIASHTDDYNAAAAVHADLFNVAQARAEARAEADAAQIAAGVHASQFESLGAGPDVGDADLWTPATYTQAVTAHVEFLAAQDRFELARVRAALKLARDHMERRFAGLVAKTKAEARRAFAALSDE